MNICENCSNEHNGEYGSGRFCCIKCSRGFATKSKRKEINEKVSKSLTKKESDRKHYTETCIECKIEFTTRFKKQKCCSRSCGASFSRKQLWKTDSYRMKISKIASDRHANNEKGFGWQTRKKLIPSYPESIAIKYLDYNNIKYEREWQFDRYFVDFALHDKKIAIEIDGQQHNLPDRIISDKLKDDKLKSLGWNVFRIKFPKENIIEKLDLILK